MSERETSPEQSTPINQRQRLRRYVLDRIVDFKDNDPAVIAEGIIPLGRGHRELVAQLIPPQNGEDTQLNNLRLAIIDVARQAVIEEFIIDEGDDSYREMFGNDSPQVTTYRRSDGAEYHYTPDQYPIFNTMVEGFFRRYDRVIPNEHDNQSLEDF